MLLVLMRQIKELVERNDPKFEKCWERVEMTGEEIILNADFIAQKYGAQVTWDQASNKIIFTKEPENKEECASEIVDNMIGIYYELRNDLLLLFSENLKEQ